MRKMLKTHQNTIGNLAITLLFVGGCIFLLTGSWDASETEAATGCCGGGDATLVAGATGGCCGGTNKASSSGNSDCDCLSGTAGNDENPQCHLCGDSYCGHDTDGQTCMDDCNPKDCGPAEEATKCKTLKTVCENSDDRDICQTPCATYQTFYRVVFM